MLTSLKIPMMGRAHCTVEPWQSTRGRTAELNVCFISIRKLTANKSIGYVIHSFTRIEDLLFLFTHTCSNNNKRYPIICYRQPQAAQQTLQPNALINWLTNFNRTGITLFGRLTWKAFNKFTVQCPVSCCSSFNRVHNHAK